MTATETLAYPIAEHPYLRDIVTLRFEKSALEDFVAMLNRNSIRTEEGLYLTFAIEYMGDGNAYVTTCTWTEPQGEHANVEG